jgi:hypothetical protein
MTVLIRATDLGGTVSGHGSNLLPLLVFRSSTISATGQQSPADN